MSKIKGFSCSKKFLKNLTGKPSGLGDLSLCSDLMASVISTICNGASKLFLCSMDILGMSSSEKKICSTEGSFGCSEL